MNEVLKKNRKEYNHKEIRQFWRYLVATGQSQIILALLRFGGCPQFSKSWITLVGDAIIYGNLEIGDIFMHEFECYFNDEIYQKTCVN